MRWNILVCGAFALCLSNTVSAQVFTPPSPAPRQKPKPAKIKESPVAVPKRKQPVAASTQPLSETLLPPSGNWAEDNLSYPRDGRQIREWTFSKNIMTSQSSFTGNDGIKIVVNYVGQRTMGWSYRVRFKRSDGIVGSADYNFYRNGSIWKGSATYPNTKGGSDDLKMTFIGEDKAPPVTN